MFQSPNDAEIGMRQFRNLTQVQQACDRHAQRLLSDTGPEMRQLGPMPADAERMVTDEIIRVARTRLSFVDALLSAGMTTSLPNWLQVPVMEWNLTGHYGNPVLTMELQYEQGERARPNLTPQRIAIPLFMDVNHWGARELAVSQRPDVSPVWNLVQESTREQTEGLNRKIEDCAINGAPIFQFKGETFYGALNAPNAATFNFVDSESWLAAGHNGPDVVDDMFSGIDALRANNRFGPYGAFVSAPYWRKLQEDYEVTGNRDSTILERVQRIASDNGAPLQVRQVDFLPTDTVIVMEMSPSTMTMIVGQTPTPLTWLSPNGWQTYLAIVACIIPWVKWDLELQSGIAIGTPT